MKILFWFDLFVDYTVWATSIYAYLFSFFVVNVDTNVFVYKLDN